jgi:hypothetical protein
VSAWLARRTGARPMPGQLIDEAGDLIARILEDDPERLHHCAGVAARAQTLVATVPISAADAWSPRPGCMTSDTRPGCETAGFTRSTGPCTFAGKAGPTPSATLSRIIRVAASSRVFAGSTID